MKEKKQVKEFLLTLLSTLVLFAIFSGIFLAVTVWSESSTLNVSRNNLVDSEQQLASTETSVIYNRVSRLTSDLTYIRDTLNLVDLTPEHYGDIGKQWISFADHQYIYDQICFMDTQGNELIRVNYSRDGSYAVPAKQLQNKAEYYYFQRALPLAANQIYISRLDLSVEEGVIETPVKPMIRLAIPYYDTAGTLRGVVCLNYLAEDMLDRVRSVGTGGNGGVFLLSSEGYWLYNSENAGREWSFMYPGRENDTFERLYPQEWERMQKDSQGAFITKNGLFAYESVMSSQKYEVLDSSYVLVQDEGNWRVVTHVAATGQFAEILSIITPKIALQLIKENILIYLTLLALSLALSSLLSHRRGKKERLRYFAEYDEMTGALNRRAGVARLERTAHDLLGEGRPLSLCFMDVNGLKDVNDLLGHHAGDELIMTVVSFIRKNIRHSSDFLVRMGGDEFMLVLGGLSPEAAEGVWQRIRADFDRLNETGEKGYLISVSHGIEAVETEDHMDAVINRADAKMYAEKREIKRSGHFIRQT